MNNMFFKQIIKTIHSEIRLSNLLFHLRNISPKLKMKIHIQKNISDKILKLIRIC